MVLPTEFNFFVPRKSLKFICLSKLAEMMKPWSELESQSNSTITKGSTQSYISSCPSFESDLRGSTPSSSNLPMDVAQLIIDHIMQEKTPIRAQSLCFLLSHGGCYSSYLGELFSINWFGDDEKEEIFASLAKNSYHLHRLHLPRDSLNTLVNLIFKENNLVKLQYLKLCFKLQKTCNHPEDLFAILSACPNLIRLELEWLFTDYQTTKIIEELKKSTYNQIRNSLSELTLHFNLSKYAIIKLVSLFPNLTKLKCDSMDWLEIFEIIKTAQDVGFGLFVNFLCLDEDVNVTATEMQKTCSILSKLQSLCASRPFRSDVIGEIVALSPGLQALVLSPDVFDLYDLNAIGNLKHLKALHIDSRISFVLILPILEQIGHNLEVLILTRFVEIDVSIIDQYCDNLMHLSIHDPEILTCLRAISDPTKYKQKRVSKRPFLNLLTFSLGLEPSDEEWHLADNVIPYILNNAVKIEKIELSGAMDITEEKLTDLVQNNPLKNLRVLIILYANPFSLPISHIFFNNFIHSLDKLCYADLKNCIEAENEIQYDYEYSSDSDLDLDF